MLSQALELFPAYFCRPRDRSVAENTPALVGSWTRCWILLKSVSCLILARVLFGSLVSTWIPKCQGQRRKYRGFVLLLDWWRSSFILFMENRNKLFGQSNIYAWRREWQPTPVSLPGKPHGQRSLASCSPRGHKESDMTERLNNNNRDLHSF